MTWTLKAEGGTRAADRDEVRRALSILIDPGQTFEIRGLIGEGRARGIVCRSVEEGVTAAEELSSCLATWFTLNPCRPDLSGSASNPDILSRRWLLIDCDSERPKDASATTAEKDAAIDLACDIAEYLSGLGWPDGVWIDSGNGGHLLYPIDLPNDALSKQLIKGVLCALGDRFDSDKAKVDRGNIKAAQVSKLPGTWACKGPHTEERPHRMSRLVRHPADPGEIVTAEMMQALASPPKADAPTVNPWAKATGGQGLERYVRSAIERECARVIMTTEGGRNNALNVAAFNLATMSQWPELNAADAKLSLWEAAKRSGLGEHEIKLTIESGWKGGAEKPRQRPAETTARAKAAPRAEVPIDPNKRLIIWAKDVTPRKVDWLWPGRIPVGKATTFAGQTGMGKTFTLCDIASRISRGMEIPFGGGECFRQGKVLIISAEDDADDTLVPRLIDLGADLSRIAFLSPDVEGNFSLAALDLLGRSLDQMDGDVRMVAIDPPTSFLAGVDDHKNAELRSVLAPLRHWTISRQVALVMITHINKGGSGNVDAMARVMGGAAWVQAVRAAHMFCADPDERGKSLFVPLKVNNAKPRPGIRYQITEQEDGRVVVSWEDEVQTSADEALGATKRKPRGVCAAQWVEERFREQHEWLSDELKRAAKEFGLSNNALFSAEVNALPITKRKRADAAGDIHWYWIANDGWPKR